MMKHFIPHIYRTVAALITTGIIASGTVLAHPGHNTEAHGHDFLDGVNLLVLVMAIALAFVIDRVIRRIF